MKRRTPRTLLVVENLPVPFNRRVWLEAKTLAQNGYDVRVICPKSKEASRSVEILEGIRIYRYPLPLEAGGGFLGYLLEFAWCLLATAWLSLRLAVAEGRFDVIHACNPP